MSDSWDNSMINEIQWQSMNLSIPNMHKPIVVVWKKGSEMKSAIIILKKRMRTDQYEDLYLAQSMTKIGDQFVDFEYRLSDFSHHKWMYLPELNERGE